VRGLRLRHALSPVARLAQLARPPVPMPQTCPSRGAWASSPVVPATPGYLGATGGAASRSDGNPGRRGLRARLDDSAALMVERGELLRAPLVDALRRCPPSSRTQDADGSDPGRGHLRVPRGIGRRTTSRMAGHNLKRTRCRTCKAVQCPSSARSACKSSASCCGQRSAEWPTTLHG
jgi:hypothetical protein